MRNLTQAQAMAVYRKIAKHFHETAHPRPVEQGAGPWPDGPLLVRNFDWSGNGPTRWAVVWEEGPHDWALNVPVRHAAAWTEPITGWALALHPREA